MSRKGEGAYEAQSSDHHASEQMMCESCWVPWPCQMFLEARRLTPPRNLIVLKREKRLPNGEVQVARLR